MEEVSSQGSVQSGRFRDIHDDRIIARSRLPCGRLGRRLALVTRDGAPTERMTARPTTKQARKNKIVVNDRCLIICESLKGQPHGIQGAEKPRLRSHYPRVQRRHQTWVLIFHCYRTTSKTISIPGAKTRSVPVAADTTTRNSRLKSQKEVPFGKPKVCNLP